jgi:hypothetical protein
MTNDLDAAALRKKVLALAETMEDFEVAEACKVSLAQVRQITGNLSIGRRWAAVNHKTGQVIEARTERGIYRLAQIKGWVDWAYVEAPR